MDFSRIEALRNIAGRNLRDENYSEVPEDSQLKDYGPSTLNEDLMAMENRARKGRDETSGLWSKYDLYNKKKDRTEHDVAYGHKLTPEEMMKGEVYGNPIDSIDDKAANSILSQDQEKARAGLMRLLKRRDIDSELLSPSQLDGLTNMSYQMGSTGLGKFKDMLGAFRNNDIEGIEREALDSDWARTHPSRAKEVIKKLLEE